MNLRSHFSDICLISTLPNIRSCTLDLGTKTILLQMICGDCLYILGNTYQSRVISYQLRMNQNSDQDFTGTFWTPKHASVLLPSLESCPCLHSLLCLVHAWTQTLGNITGYVISDLWWDTSSTINHRSLENNSSAYGAL